MSGTIYSQPHARSVFRVVYLNAYYWCLTPFVSGNGTMREYHSKQSFLRATVLLLLTFVGNNCIISTECRERMNACLKTCPPVMDRQIQQHPNLGDGRNCDARTGCERRCHEMCEAAAGWSIVSPCH